MADAESFYDKLLASIPQCPRTEGSTPEDLAWPIPNAPPVSAADTIMDAPPADKSDSDSEAGISPSSTRPMDIDTPQTGPRPVAKKDPAKLEAELRARLLAAKKPKPLVLHTPAKRPPRGSPVFTAVPLSAVEISSSSAPTPAQTPVTAPIMFEGMSQVQGRLRLPPRPPQREGFRLRVKLPFNISPLAHMVVETEKMALYTPISAVLDLFNRRSPHDYLYFPSAHPPLSGDTVDGGVEQLETQQDRGQRFYRDPPKSVEKAGWREVAAARGGTTWDANTGNLRATLEDVATVAGAVVVDCEIRNEPKPVPAHSPDADLADNKINSHHEEEEVWHGEEAEEQDWDGSPGTEQGEWSYNDPAYSPNSWMWPGMFPFAAPWFSGGGFPMQMPAAEPNSAAATTPTSPIFPATTSEVKLDGQVPRWIPGHEDYDKARHKFGFNKPRQKERDPVPRGSRHLAVRPPPLPPAPAPAFSPTPTHRSRSPMETPRGPRGDGKNETRRPRTPRPATPVSASMSRPPHGPRAHGAPPPPPALDSKKPSRKRGGAPSGRGVQKRKNRSGRNRSGRAA
jgi:hypothetical protein